MKHRRHKQMAARPRIGALPAGILASLALASAALGGAAPARKGESPRAEAAPPSVVLCHQSTLTLTVPEPARDAHLGHGDAAGACPATSTAAPAAESKQSKQAKRAEKAAGRSKADAAARAGERSQDKVTICHKGRKALSVGASAKDAHLAHGDALGACPAGTAKQHGKARGHEKTRPTKPAKAAKPAKPSKPARPASPGKAKGHSK